MDVKAKEIIEVIENIAPVELQECWDNSGLQIGDSEEIINGILFVMDVTDKSIDYAIKNNLNFIISHHPLFFEGVKSINFSNYKGNLIKKIIENNVVIYSSHTCLDKAEFGVNQVLAQLFKLSDVKKLADYEENNIGVIGKFDGSLNDLVKIIKDITPIQNVNFYGRKKDHINKIGVIGGSGSSGIDLCVRLGCDCLITADIKHHDGQKAYENEILLIDIQHFYSEYPVLNMLKDNMERIFRNIEIKIFNEPVYLINDLIDLD